MEPQRAPTAWVTYILIALNVAAFAAIAAMGVGMFSVDADKLVAVGGSLPALTLSGEPWRLVTCMFLHAGFLHLAMNMLALYSGGRAAELMFGRTGYLAIYLASGLVGGVATLTKTAMVVSVGASGAIFGVFGAIFGFLVAHRTQIDPEARARQMKNMGTFVGLNLLIGITVPAISLAAHVGGFGAGFVIAYLAERGLDLEDRDAARKRRLPRILIGSVLALGVVAAGLAFLPKSKVAYMTKSEAALVAALDEKLQKFGATEKQLLQQQNEAAQRAVKGEITFEEQARIFREDLVPAWRWVGKDLASVTGLPPVIAKRQQAMIAYIDARVAHIESTVALLGLADDDPAAAGALSTMTAKEAAVVSALENVKKAFAAPGPD